MNMGAVLLFEEEVGATSAMLGELCVAPYMGARAFPADLNSHLTDSRLPSRALEKSIETFTRQTCKKAPLPAQYKVFLGIHLSSVEPE